MRRRDAPARIDMLVEWESELEAMRSELEAQCATLASRQREIAEELDDVRRVLARLRIAQAPAVATTDSDGTSKATLHRSPPAPEAVAGRSLRGRTRNGAGDPIERAMAQLSAHVRLAEGPSFYLRELIRVRSDEGTSSVVARQIARSGPDGKVSATESANASTNLRRLAAKGLVERENDEKPARYRLTCQAEEWIAVT